MRVVTVFWPLGEQGEGFVIGWRTKTTIVVCGVAAFPSRDGAFSAISSLRQDQSKYGHLTNSLRSVEILGTSTQTSQSLKGSLPILTWGEDVEDTNVILYRCSEPAAMRLYCLDMLDLDMLLAIRPLNNHAPRFNKYAADITAQFSMVPHSSISSIGGISSGDLEKVNSARFVIKTLQDSQMPVSLPRPKTTLVKAIQHATSPVVRPIRRALSSVYLKTIKSIFSHFGVRSATVQQIDLRLEQIQFVIEQLRIYGNQNSVRDITLSARYISAQNCIWLILNDMIIGAAAGSFLYENRIRIGQVLYQYSKIITVDLLRQGIHWLDNWPAGLKLNTELSRFLYYILSGVLGIWEVIVDRLAVRFSTIIGVLGLCGLLGLTMILSISSDLFWCLTVHLNVTYSLVRVAYKSQLTTTNSLFNLFRGKRYNILRQRLDSWDYDLDQLLLGAMLFTLISFLFPTITTYYVLFALARLSYIAVHACIEVILALLNHFPLFALTLRFKDPRRLPGGIYFEPIPSSQVTTPCLLMKNSPLPLSRIFNQYVVLGSRLLSFYSPPRLFVILSKGDPLNRIPHRHIRYSYGRIAEEVHETAVR